VGIGRILKILKKGLLVNKSAPPIFAVLFREKLRQT
jgi:hypothetical protein